MHLSNKSGRKNEIPRLICFFDGSIGPSNPGGNMGWGAYISKYNFETDKEDELYFDCGGEKAATENTNNVAEYKALELVLDFLLTQPPSEIFIQGDSMLVIKQMTGRWRIKEGAYVETAKVCKEKLGQIQKLHLFKDVRFNPNIKWIPREENLFADELSNRGREKF